MLNKYSRKHIGEEFVTNEGHTLKVTDGGRREGYCTIQIHEWRTEVQYSNASRGIVKYPYHASICGVGFHGIGKYRKTTHKKTYVTWKSMFERCYTVKYRQMFPTYIEAKVHKEWHNFQVFAKWFSQNYIEGYHLDKDLMSTSKVYSSNTCIFIPGALNSFLTNVQISNTSGEVGVSWHKRNKKWVTSINIDGKHRTLGRFNDKQEASRTYKIARAKQADKWKQQMTGILPQTAIDKIS